MQRISRSVKIRKTRKSILGILFGSLALLLMGASCCLYRIIAGYANQTAGNAGGIDSERSLAAVFIFGGIILIVLIFLFWRYEKIIFQSVYKDEVTGGNNYEYLEMTFKGRRQKGNLFFVTMDVDNFNAFNILYGSETGDKLLRYIYNAFEEEIPDGEIYRKHSDYFTAIVNGDGGIENKVAGFTERVKKDIADGVTMPFSLSIGISGFEGDMDLNTTYTNALLAKDTVKRTSGIKYAFYDVEIKKRQLKNLEMNTAFDKAVLNREFQVYYQPKYNISTGEIIGAEALIRWVKSDGTVIYPGEFIPCIEMSGKIVLLDEIVIDMVCSQMREMRRSKIDVRRVSINLSRVHLERPYYILKKIKQAIEDYEIDPSKLSFEITESAFYNDEGAVNKLVDSLHEIGCQVDLDDFGTGISGLSALTKTNFDTVKLDRDFLEHLSSKKTEIIVKSTIDMVSRMGMELVVEGVENKDQEGFLLLNHCTLAQGYFYSRPVPAETYKLMVKSKVENESKQK